MIRLASWYPASIRARITIHTSNIIYLDIKWPLKPNDVEIALPYFMSEKIKSPSPLGGFSTN